MQYELAQALAANKNSDVKAEFNHLENAHVLGQESTYWHVKVHFLMLFWGIRNRKLKECIGQVLRIIGASTKTAIGLVPQGNTGGTNVSPFKVMPLSSEYKALISEAKQGV